VRVFLGTTWVLWTDIGKLQSTGSGSVCVLGILFSVLGKTGAEPVRAGAELDSSTENPGCLVGGVCVRVCFLFLFFICAIMLRFDFAKKRLA